MTRKTYQITTFGCQMNEHDSEKLAGMLENMGYSESSEKNDADVIIINTCSVREHADERFFGTLGQLKKIRQLDHTKTIAVCGCMMQQQHIIDRLKSKYPWVDLIFGTHNLHEFPMMLVASLNERHKIVDVWDENGEIIEGLPMKRTSPYKASVSIMYGCNNFCTYCVVPYTRGRERSRAPEEILNEIRKLAAEGTKELLLLGQNVNSYGNSSDFALDFSGLLYEIEKIDGIERVRFMTSHPKDLSDRLIMAYQDCKKISGHIHLPVQSGSTEILKRMNRNYDREDYLLLIKKLRHAVPDIAITTDIIVGFPGETETDFQDTLTLAAEAAFDSAYTFIYSPRKGTPAADYGEQVPEEVKHSRFNRLVDLLNDISLQKNLQCLDQVMDVLVEGQSKTNSSMFTGRTSSNKLVNFSAIPDDIGKIIKVRIIEARTFNLSGRRENPALY